MKKIYIAGKYDDVNVRKVLLNIRAGIEMAVKVLKNGDIPFCPFLDFLFILMGEGYSLDQDALRNYSMKWLEVCDEVWFLPSCGSSKGCRAEWERAKELNIPIHFIEVNGIWGSFNE
jgi:hypothetical protein